MSWSTSSLASGWSSNKCVDVSVAGFVSGNPFAGVVVACRILKPLGLWIFGELSESGEVPTMSAGVGGDHVKEVDLSSWVVEVRCLVRRFISE